ncbi:MAG: META domain-containing protein [Chloroflexota bacterium]
MKPSQRGCLTLLSLCIIMLGLVGCRQTAGPSFYFPERDRVFIRLHNASDLAFKTVKVGFADREYTVHDLAAGETADPLAFIYAYPSANLEIVTEDNTYVLEKPPTDTEAPVTAGHYLLTLNAHDVHAEAVLSMDVEQTRKEVQPLIDHLEARDVELWFHPKLLQGSLFDQMAGYAFTDEITTSIYWPELIITVFDDEETAIFFANTIQPSGTELVYRHETGEIIEYTVPRNDGEYVIWWRYSRYLLRLASDHRMDIADVQEALALEPIYELDPALTEPIQVRITNLSDKDFEHVWVQFPKETVNYGTIPSGQTSSYEVLEQAYNVAPMGFNAGDKFYKFPEVAHLGPPPLLAGRYTYYLTLRSDGIVSISALDDDKTFTDPLLLNQNWYWIGSTPYLTGPLQPATSQSESWPFVRFTTELGVIAGHGFNGFGGCNQIAGNYIANGPRFLVIKQVNTTQMTCGNQVTESEAFLIKSLQGKVSYRRMTDFLLVYVDGWDVLLFTNEQPLTPPHYRHFEAAALTPVLLQLHRDLSLPSLERLEESPFPKATTWSAVWSREPIAVHIFDEAVPKAVADSVSDTIHWINGRFLITYHGESTYDKEQLDDLLGQ